MDPVSFASGIAVGAVVMWGIDRGLLAWLAHRWAVSLRAHVRTR